MRTSGDQKQHSGMRSTMGDDLRDSESQTLSAVSREGVAKLVSRANASHLSGMKKQDNPGQCVAMTQRGPKRNGKQVDRVVTWNDLDSRSVIEDRAHYPMEADVGSFQASTCNADEEMDDTDWEDGSTPVIGSAKGCPDDSTGKITIEFNESLPDSAQRKAVRRATAEEKELAELVHRVHLLCLLARGRVIDTACDDPLIQASLLSLLPTHLLKISEVSKLTASALSPLVHWFHNYFHVSSSVSERRPFSSALAFALENRRGSTEEIAALAVALFRALRLTTRFVSILDVASIKPDADRCGSSSQDINRVSWNLFETSTLMVDKTKDGSIPPVKSFSFDKRNNAGETSSKTPGKSEDRDSSSKKAQSRTPVAVKLENQMVESNTLACMSTETKSEECGTSKSQSAKRKGDLEFETQLQMALSATAVGAPQRTVELDVKSSIGNLSNIHSSMKRLKRITGEDPSSQGLSTAVGSRKTGSPLYWAEVYCSGENLSGKWVHIDAVNSIVDGEEKVEAAATACKTSLRYVVAFAGSGAKDVTRRYCTRWYKIASQRVNSSWWDAVLAPLRELELGATGDHVKLSGESVSSEVSIDSGRNVDFGFSGENSFAATRNCLEDKELETRALTETLPTNQQAYKNHQLYAIERWLTKSQILHPKGPVLGFCSGHPVYPRSCVQTLKTKERWLREALQLKANELPAKVLKQSGKLKKGQFSEEDGCGEADSKGIIELYGRWQVEPLQLPHAVNGIVPRNERGQVDVWSEKCLPPGTVHIRLPRVFNIAKRLEIDYAPAMVGFEFKNGRSVPVFDGIVVCTEFKDVILEAYAEEEQRREAEENKKNEAQALSRWYQLLSSIITRQRLNNTYGESSMPEIPSNINNRDEQNADANTSDEVLPERQEKNMMHCKVDDPPEGHEHIFFAGDQTFDEARSVRTKRCRCGFSIQVEEL